VTSDLLGVVAYIGGKPYNKMFKTVVPRAITLDGKAWVNSGVGENGRRVGWW